MVASIDGWQVERAVDDTAAYAVLAGDRGWTGYVIADLEPPFREHAQLAVARAGQTPPAAACLVLRHPDVTAVVPHGDPAGVGAILDAIDLPGRTFVSARPEHLPALERHYSFSSEPREMRRMHATTVTFTLPRALPAVERLGPTDAAGLMDLYTGYAESFFAPNQLAYGVFYGVRDGAGIVAAGGTHVISRRHGVAAVGNIYTRPSARGHGYATAITAAVVEELLALPCRDVILNVAVANTAAAIYARLGFRDHCTFWEGRAERREGA